MVSVTVFRHVPRPIIGTIGTLYDPTFQAFEATLDWLETNGVLVEQFDPASAPNEVARWPAVRQLLAEKGDGCLPLIVVNDAVVSQGVYVSRSQLARMVGNEERRQRSAA